ncbi:MAG: TRADD-N-associated membrane domain-containing protein, partial [Cetobacterium sp.]
FILITLVVLSTYLFVSYIKLIFRFLLSLYKGRIKSYQIDEEKIKINKKDEFFNRLVEINFKYLDQYYFQTKEQADKSFFLVITSGIIGLGIIIVGIVLVYKGEQEPGNIAATAGILIEFITAIFFYIYNKTILKTGEYHKKLVLSQNISLALKTTEDFQGKEKFELREKIISEITKDINKYLCS